MVIEAIRKFRVGVNAPRVEEYDIMVVFGLSLLIIGFVLAVKILWSIGVIVPLIGLVLGALGSLGHAVGGRRHYFWSSRSP